MLCPLEHDGLFIDSVYQHKIELTYIAGFNEQKIGNGNQYTLKQMNHMMIDSNDDRHKETSIKCSKLESNVPEAKFSRYTEN